MTVVGLDIGGANLKGAHLAGPAFTQPFPLWKQPAQLSAELIRLLAFLPAHDTIALTMTGELCDCFHTKREGVHAILAAVEAAAPACLKLVWLNDGTFVDVPTARARPLQVASSNWLATATFVGRLVPTGSAVLVDLGSTTTDLIPLYQGQPIPSARTDPSRLQAKELVYTGFRRTPLCALLGSAVAAELFATTLDAYLLLGLIPDSPDDCDTADGQPATRAYAHARLARLLCADAELCTRAETQRLADQARAAQFALLQAGYAAVSARLPTEVSCLILAGSGEPLLHEWARQQAVARVVSLQEKLGSARSTAACAVALAQLAADHLGRGA